MRKNQTQRVTLSHRPNSKGSPSYVFFLSFRRVLGKSDLESWSLFSETIIPHGLASLGCSPSTQKMTRFPHIKLFCEFKDFQPYLDFNLLGQNGAHSITPSSQNFLTLKYILSIIYNISFFLFQGLSMLLFDNPAIKCHLLRTSDSNFNCYLLVLLPTLRQFISFDSICRRDKHL